MSGLVNSIHFIVAASCFLLVAIMSWKKKPKWWAVSLLMLIGASSLTLLPVGVWLGNTIRNLGPGPVFLMTVATVAIASYDIGRDKKADKAALFCLFMLPVLFEAGNGWIAEIGQLVTTSAASGGVAGIAAMMGG
ncbi:hypothetical protein [Saccharopolyspora sp. 6V]|uniref:hypothetical protein n=1 Tax=Saccharopolyspora sp. 6V TaxID=2877239 RepID=UPI001CD23C87|nr:hypothetical protein [Saccharopolyspora sp. 6V]MCA1191642.1 hypothetical protein [Saccharopolyspora sp. 6V]